MHDKQPNSVQVPVLDCVAESYQFFLQNWMKFLPAAFIVAAISTVSSLLSTGALAEFGFSIVSGLAGVAFAAAVIRKIVFDDFKSPIGITLGADEFRLFVATVVIVLTFLPVAFLISIIAASVLMSRLGLGEAELERLSANPQALRETLSGVVAPADILLAVVLLLPLLWLAARWFLVNPGTIGEGRLVILQSWRWTRGNVFRTMAAVLLTAAPLVAFSVLLLSANFLSAEPSQLTTVLLLGGAGVVSALLRIPLIALSAILYLGLRKTNSSG